MSRPVVGRVYSGVTLPKQLTHAIGLDGGKADLGGQIGVEFYVKDRVSFSQACEGAKQEPAFG